MLAGDAQAVVYSVKCYAAAMLAYYIALRIGLDRPYWAITTCYITAAPQPLAGAILSKSLFRFLGTLLGSTVAVILVPNLVNEPIALSLALAAWLGVCTYVSLLDRTPRAYVFLLAGYTASIIGFPSVDAPGAIFDVAILRVQEITLGILCTALMHGAVFPLTLTGRLNKRVDQILADAEGWTRQALAGPRDPVLDRARRKLALEVNELLTLTIQLPFDTARLVPRTKVMNALQDRLTMLLPLGSAVEDRLAELHDCPGGMPAPLAELTDRVVEWLAHGIRAPDRDATATAMLVEMQQQIDAGVEGSVWRRMLALNLLARLGDVVATHRDARALSDQLRAPGWRPVAPQVERLVADARGRSLHRDHASAAWVGLSAALVIGLGCLFWIATAWPSGAGAVLIAGVTCALFGNLPHAPKIIVLFCAGVTGGVLLATLYGYVVLPRVTDPVMLAIVLAPVLLFLGCVLARPALGALGLAGAIGFINTVGFADTYQGDFASFLNGSIALVAGIGGSAVVLSLTQIGSARRSAMSLLRSAYRDVAQRATRRGMDQVAWTSRMLDRVGLLSTTEVHQDLDPGRPVLDVLRDMRTGYVAGVLGDMRGHATAAEDGSIDAILTGVAGYYGSLDPRAPVLPPGHLLADIDRGVDAFAADEDVGRRREGLSLLTSIRRNLFPTAAPVA